jgi:hypothetical protein
MGLAVAVTVLDVVTVLRVDGLLVVVEAELLEGPLDEVETNTEPDFEEEVETSTELDFEDEVEALIELVVEDEDETCIELDFEDEVELLTKLEVDETGHVPEADPTNMTSVYPPSVQKPTNEASLPAALGAKVKGMVIVAPEAICCLMVGKVADVNWLPMIVGDPAVMLLKGPFVAFRSFHARPMIVKTVAPLLERVTEPADVWQAVIPAKSTVGAPATTYPPEAMTVPEA